jgi:two-component system, chemotaxis family, chemotaxis protein CheY
MVRQYLDTISFLIVDDSAFVRRTCRAVLHAMGSRDISEAGNGDDALRLLERHQPDIMIVNWEMAPMSGIELVGRIRSNPDHPMAFTPVIMLTGHSELARVIFARDAGVNEFVVKPFSPRSLFVRIQAVVERPRPFVRTKNYFGPDRRRKEEPVDAEKRSKKKRGDRR